ncbi:hypothetical protein LDENG_00249410 [Lucifuga dentata]|nr:hypothetical protein LDENG_00249410 [Lucifuga dentata]
MASQDKLLSEYLRQQKTEGDEEQEETSWKTKPLHGTYHRQIEGVTDITKSYQCLEKAGLKDSTEALIMAALEQALSTRSIEAGLPQQTGPTAQAVQRCP